jgi:hypothetical protein
MAIFMFFNQGMAITSHLILLFLSFVVQCVYLLLLLDPQALLSFGCWGVLTNRVAKPWKCVLNDGRLNIK